MNRLIQSYLLRFAAALVRSLLMHAYENFEDVSAQGQGLGAEAKNEAEDLPVEIKAKTRTLKMSSRIPKAKDISSRTPLAYLTAYWMTLTLH